MSEKLTDLEQRVPAHKEAAGPARDALIDEFLLRNASKSELLAETAPDSTLAKYGLVTGKGLLKLPEGIKNATVHSITHPLETLETLGAGAAMGAVLKTVLPEAGVAGKIAAGAIGAYFTYKAARPVMEAYSEAGNARTMADLDLAAVKLGNAGGEFIVGSAIAGVGYKLGAGAADRILLTERMDGFADAKQAFWDGAQDKVVKASTKLTDALHITKPVEPLKLSGSVSLDPAIKEGYSRFLPSEKRAPGSATLLGEVNPTAEMEATLMLKSKASDLALDRALRRVRTGQRSYFSDQEFAEKFGASNDALAEVNKFASENNLKVAETDLRSGRVVLKGSAGDFSNAFQTKLSEYKANNGVTFRGREGALALPDTLQRNIEGVFGLDDRPHARNYSIRLEDFERAKAALKTQEIKLAKQSAVPEMRQGLPDTSRPFPEPGKTAKSGGYLPTEVADAYNFPKNSMGEGTSVAIIELGGGIDLANEAAYYKQHGLPQPKIDVISVGGAKTKTGIDVGADGEVSLDSQIVGAIAPKANQKVIFGQNSDKGFIDSITRATFPEAGEKPTTSISISWGAPEESWTDQGVKGLTTAFKKAALKGISIFAAAGDDGAIDKAPSGKYNADYPSSDPNVTAAGGTRLDIGSDGKIRSEKVWNGSGGATGGGVSQRFEVPEYQKGVTIPPNGTGSGPGRGVPDVAGNADPRSGWKVKVNGLDDVIGGTSAVAPMLAALDARISGELGRPVGPWNPFLYKSGLAGAPFFNDIVGGNNNGYPTTKGWDATTGWGSLEGSLFRDSIIADRSSAAPSLYMRAFLRAAKALSIDTKVS